MGVTTLSADVAVIGGGLGGVAAALAVARTSRRVVLTDEFEWLGGQLTSQAVPPDEHAWVEQFGVTSSYRRLRDGIRDYYRRNYPLTARAHGDVRLNPGDGTVSKLCAEPRVAAAVLHEMLAPFIANGLITVLRGVKPVATEGARDRVDRVVLAGRDGAEYVVAARYVIDATETGELLPLAEVDYAVGSESRHEHGEPSAPETADPTNVQAITWCFAFDHDTTPHLIDRPATYDYWHEYEVPFWGDRLLSFTAPNPRTLQPERRTMDVNPPLADVTADQSVAAGDGDLWVFRRILARRNLQPGFLGSDIVLANWPMLDYLDSSIIDVPDPARHLEAARQLSLSYFYWLQTEAPRPDGGFGWPGLRLRGDVVGTRDGLAQAPYIRESRRIKALRTVAEQDVSVAVRGSGKPATFSDSVGVGMYRIDLHPTTGGDNYLDVECAPFEIPLGALVPRRHENLLPGGKNIGTTHITNGAYRLHPVEWNIGEASGALAVYALDHDVTPQQVATDSSHVLRLQDRLAAQGVEIHWPDIVGY
ncbi:FAD-dependent oxidoreductase [Microbacterium sp. P06]|uniref:FAD-dependent oxidoreductase n=1 Tax=unclassified Microbacterium TaxID=2609290 RepID=UPI0037456458